MRKSKLALLAGALLTIFTLFSCQQPINPSTNTTGGGNSGDGNKNLVTVTFYDDYKSTEPYATINVEVGKEIDSTKLPKYPSKADNSFVYWSESKASIDKVKKFDLTQPITKNTTLYAIYTPILNKIHIVTSEKIVIKLSGTNTYPLDDGSYPEIKISYSTDSKKSYKELSIFKPSKTEDILENTHAYKYLTYNFETPLSYGDYDFKVVSKYEFDPKEYTYSFDQNKRHVYFDDNGSITQKTVDFGSPIEGASPSVPRNNYFMYWSESKSSLAEAVEFDFSQPITKDTVLYAIYTPKLWSYTYTGKPIPKLTDKEIEIQLEYTDGFPLADGSYAGIKFQHSTDNVTWEDFALTIPSSYEYIENNYSRCLIYTFPTPLSNGTHYFKVTNKPYGKEEFTASVKIIGNPKTVTFDGRTSIKTLVVEAGQAILESEKPANPNPSGNYFMYWSKSKASLAEAVEFDFSQKITEDITLYAIYKPKLYYLSSSIINKITPTQIEIKLYNKDVFPLDDGSYPGIKIQRGSSSSNLTELEVENIPSYRDDSSYRYLTYTFANNFTLPEGTHCFKVTNGEETSSTQTINLTSPKEATDLRADTADSYAKISFKAAVNGWSYKVAALKNSEEIASKTIVVNSGETGEVEFFGLENGTEYTFKVTTDGSNKSAEIKATPAITKKASDWVIAMYMDGDNNLNDPIYLDLNEAERGLYENPDSDSVKIIALWDGWDFKTNNKDKSTSFFAQAPSAYNINTEATLLLELGKDSNPLYADNGGVYFKASEISPNTKNLSYTAPWIASNRKVSTSSASYNGEVNMGDITTLENYLKWINNHYTANKGIILQFSNHGGGPRSVALKNEYGRRSMCWDETSGGKTFLKTSDVSTALKNAGYGSSNKVKLIMEDVCLGGSLEEAYELKDYSEYYIGSPNTIPGMGFDYISFVKSLTSSATIEEIGGNLVKSYKNDYTMTDAEWQNFLNKNSNFAGFTDLQKSINNSKLSTLSFIDLSKIDALATAINEYASLVYNAGTTPDEKLKYSSSEKKFYVVGLDNNIPADASFISIRDAVRYWTAYYGDPIFYEGTYGNLKDIGFMMVLLNSIYGQSENETWKNIISKRNEITAALNSAIIACWRDGYKAPTYYKNPQDNLYSVDNASYYGTTSGLGLTINCSCWVPHEGPDKKTYLYEDFADWYRNELAFGKDCTAWTNLIENWFLWTE